MIVSHSLPLLITLFFYLNAGVIWAHTLLATAQKIRAKRESIKLLRDLMQAYSYILIFLVFGLVYALITYFYFGNRAIPSFFVLICSIFTTYILVWMAYLPPQFKIKRSCIQALKKLGKLALYLLIGCSVVAVTVFLGISGWRLFQSPLLSLLIVVSPWFGVICLIKWVFTKEAPDLQLLILLIISFLFLSAPITIETVFY